MFAVSKPTALIYLSKFGSSCEKIVERHYLVRCCGENNDNGFAKTVLAKPSKIRPTEGRNFSKLSFLPAQNFEDALPSNPAAILANDVWLREAKAYLSSTAVVLKLRRDAPVRRFNFPKASRDILVLCH